MRPWSLLPTELRLMIVSRYIAAHIDDVIGGLADYRKLRWPALEAEYVALNLRTCAETFAS